MFQPPPSSTTLATHWRVTSPTPFVPEKGIQYSLYSSVPYGVNMNCLYGVQLLLLSFWLKSLPAWSSTYWGRLSVSSSSHMRPSSPGAQQKYFLPSFWSLSARCIIPLSFSFHQAPKKPLWEPAGWKDFAPGVTCSR